MIWVKVTYISNKSSLVVDHAIPLMGFVGLSANATFGSSSGIVSAVRPESPYPCISKAKSWVQTSRRGKYCDGSQSRV